MPVRGRGKLPSKNQRAQNNFQGRRSTKANQTVILRNLGYERLQLGLGSDCKCRWIKILKDGRGLRGAGDGEIILIDSEGAYGDSLTLLSFKLGSGCCWFGNAQLKNKKAWIEMWAVYGRSSFRNIKRTLSYSSEVELVETPDCRSVWRAAYIYTN